jgi:hypothetical protein
LTVDLREAISRLEGDDLRAFYDAVEAIAVKYDANPLEYFTPYAPQIEFFRLGTEKRERLFMAGTQTGKSTSGAFETACHLTGAYPDWWPGKRFDHPTCGWSCGESATQVRETLQLKLFGMPAGQTITGGLITPEQFISRTTTHGSAETFEQCRIRHVSGGTLY